MKFRNRIHRRPLLCPEIGLTPLIDTAWTLLIVFMVTTPMIDKKTPDKKLLENALKIELPKGAVDEVQQSTTQEIVLVLDKKGTLQLNGKTISEKKLVELVQKEVGAAVDKTVFIKADVQAHYGKVIELVDTVKQIGGVSYVALATEKLT